MSLWERVASATFLLRYSRYSGVLACNPCSQLKPLLIFDHQYHQFKGRKGPSPEALRLVQSQVQRVEQDDCHVAARLQYDLLEKLLGWRS